MINIAKVIVDVPAMQVDRPFDYFIPEDLEELIRPGMRVSVPFGNRKIQGFVTSLDETEENPKLKGIDGVMDLAPVLNEELMELGDWLAEDTLSFRVSAYQAMLPAALRAKYEKYFLRLDDENEELEQLFEGYETLDWKVAEARGLLKQIGKWVREGSVEVVYQVKNKITNKKVRVVSCLKSPYQLTEIIEDMPKNAKAQSRVLAFFQAFEGSEILVSELKKQAGTTDTTIKKLADLNILTIQEKIISRDPYQNHQFEKSESLQLLPDQQTACWKITAATEQETFLIHGVTGSGKTEIYLQTIEAKLKEGKEAIVLVPEISLTPQMVERFKSRFGSEVAVLHSALSSGEKYDEWRKIERKEARVVVGARSAVFAPLENLGIIIIDEEHEASYKQEDNPRYHARDVAIWRANKYQCPVVLGSATPSLESFARAKKGVYTLIELPSRVNDRAMPEVSVVDMREELRKENRTEFSTELLEKIKDRIAKKEQTVLMLNRRGYSSFVMCRDCGYVVECPNCDISLTYHQSSNQMKCHYCGHEERVPQKCPSCEGEHIRYFGTGTQKVEESLTKLIPEARVIRMDVDTTRTKGAHEKLLKSFRNHEADILLGTQMIAKGLDFPDITLVGVLNADTMLHLPDFRASERTFQLLTQVSGRAGRHERTGEVVVQSYNPEHYSIEFAKKHDFIGFYNHEMQLRKMGSYPPFYYLTMINVSDENEMKAIRTIQEMAQFLRGKLGPDAVVLGPVPSTITRIKNKYRYQCILKYKIEPDLKKELKTLITHYQKDQQKGLTITIDVQPYVLM
ncbi:primosomal protein N' [Listeria welshimeri]|uniref:Replication restart protein PriA n=1 Tax=Listeria welshimeri serovar 6b (strain ATCC 35897 / DSM 20650 / CCUG 15529 / CIP 8149 / NCTC 11857 / SLCC 5334 / V8) TaxID=386043 RepID=A0AJS9_LISW6|nr:primosomal protein N' [Listeria welshimeri]MBC1663696.1 primosomal protein N' [Listeria welshimeri]MBC1682811.1 primosomal protein N' [Listeria welshimeri]CAK21261.1 primosomal protein N [Listeria welshimeri serovar 6b str. SLCC5334]SNV26248.1 Primosomal protein N' [Listeria welshimeri]